MFSDDEIVPFNGSTERALKVFGMTAEEFAKAEEGSIQRLNRESTERSQIQSVSTGGFSVPFNGSTERALKESMRTLTWDGYLVPFNGSTERALKGRTVRSLLPYVLRFHSTAQQREH